MNQIAGSQPRAAFRQRDWGRALSLLGKDEWELASCFPDEPHSANESELVANYKDLGEPPYVIRHWVFKRQRVSDNPRNDMFENIDDNPTEIEKEHSIFKQHPLLSVFGIAKDSPEWDDIVKEIYEDRHSGSTRSTSEL